MRHEAIRTGDPIHPAWCTCSDCTLDAPRVHRLDLLLLAMGVAAALATVGIIKLAPIVAGAVRGLLS